MTKPNLILEKLNSIERLLKQRADEVLTFRQACEYLNLSASYLYKLTSSGTIPHSKPNGKRIYFSKFELDAWLVLLQLDKAGNLFL